MLLKTMYAILIIQIIHNIVNEYRLTYCMEKQMRGQRLRQQRTIQSEKRLRNRRAAHAQAIVFQLVHM